MGDLFKQHTSLQSVFSKVKIAEALFPKEEYNDDRIRRIVSLAKKSIEDFLVLESIATSPDHVHRSVVLARYFLDQGHWVYLEQFLKVARRKLLRPPSDTSASSFIQYHLYRIQSEASMRSQNKHQTNFQAANDSLDQFYIQEKLKLHAAMRTLAPLGPPHIYDYTLAGEIEGFIESRRYLDSALIQLYHAAGQLALSPVDTDQVGMLMDQLRANADRLSPYDFRQLAGFFLNSLDRLKLSEGEPVRRQIFSLLKELLDRKAIYIEGHIATPWFNRTVFSALHLGEHEWLEDFLYDHEGKIAGEYGHQIWELAMLRYTFGMGAYQQVLNRIGSYRFTNERFNLWARIIRWKSLFELACQSQESNEEFEALDKLELDLRATIAYTKNRRKLHPDQLNKTLALLHWFRRLANRRFYNRETTETLTKDLARESFFPHELQWIGKHLASIR